jgi:hypothetical protein
VVADEAQIYLQHQHQQGDHSEYYQPADMPEVYFDSDLQEIILYADGYADYYDVDIISLSTMMAVISTQVDGYGDSIDVSLLPDDDYKIVITSSYNNVYEGQFTNY